LPAVVTSMLVLWLGDYSPRVQWTLTALIIGVLAGLLLRDCASAWRRRCGRSPICSEAMREGDYSIRARHSKSDDPWAK
jgi:two-component system nitrogen regulation sensor histidine kinase NtrY